MIGAFFAMFAADNEHIALMVDKPPCFLVHLPFYFFFGLHH
jgi:hypothetical protein